MATIKFSNFSAGGTGDAGTTQLVGYKTGDAIANYRYAISDLATMIAPSLSPVNIYTTDGTTGTGRLVTMTDTIEFRTSNIYGYTGFKFQSAFANSGVNQNAHMYIDNDTFVSKYVANEGYSFGLGNTTNSFHFNTNATTMSDGYAMRVHANTASPYGALILKGYGTSTAKNFTVQDSGANEVFSIQDDGVIKISGQVYTELVDAVNATLTVDWNNGNIQELTSLTGSLSFTASNPKIGATYILTLGQTGAVTPTWTGIKWPAATAPTLSGAGKTDIITLICYDATGAGLYYATSVLNYTT